MGQKVTLGGDRLGSGNKNKIALHNYERSTHNLSQRWTSSMGPGILYPFLCIPTTRGEAFEIDLEAACRTIPTKGPLFGSFKMQVDVFQYPFRLAQAILHNNPTAIGLKMNQIKLPMLEPTTKSKLGNNPDQGWFNNSCLLKYLGMSGMGRARRNTSEGYIARDIMAVPILGYYDIFKNYYSNKQEQNAYVIGINEGETRTIDLGQFANITDGVAYTCETEYCPVSKPIEFDLDDTTEATEKELYEKVEVEIVFDYEGVAQYGITKSLKEWNEYYANLGYINIFKATKPSANENWVVLFRYNEFIKPQIGGNPYAITFFPLYEQITDVPNTLALKPFDLANIDSMRMEILSHNNLGTPFMIWNQTQTQPGEWGKNSGKDQTGLPYSTLFRTLGNGETWNHYPLNGLMVKTYQSDIFNNWINTEWIDGENGIAEITKIATTDGAFKIDALNLAEKLYNMLNRIAVSGNTYEDWQDAVYTQSPRRHIESPVYLGGMSSEVVFEEIVQTAPAETKGDASELGTLGGRGVLIKRKGGNVDVKTDEASFIIGIVSLTPRLNYTQGNEWYLTDLQTMDDLHKPALDGIGFQNLIGEQLAWYDTVITNDSAEVYSRSTIGKVPAWINYMTAVDKAFGDFAEPDGKGFMVLSRNYDRAYDYENHQPGGLLDATTYIDPKKFNYAFAYTELDSQNFWVQIQSIIRARRLMSAKQIPNV